MGGRNEESERKKIRSKAKRKKYVEEGSCEEGTKLLS